MRIYLAGPINKCSREEMLSWREEYTHKLKNFGHEVINPALDFYPDPMTYDKSIKIVENDTDSIRKCDVVIVKHDRPSMGTAMEILYAHILNIPVIVVSNIKKEELSPWVIAHAYYITDYFPDEELKELDERRRFFRNI